ncbi:MAG: translation initiation factor IF-2, partial [Actinobacteria bacterium]|nr:translation initiation factor IF-2 [Actinomycetota bacterium]
PMGARPSGQSGQGGGGGGGGGYRGGGGGGGQGQGFGAGFGTRGGPAAGPGNRGGGGPNRGRTPGRRRRRRRDMEELGPSAITAYMPSNAPVPEGEIIIERGSSAQDVGPKLNRTAGDVVRFLFGQGEMVMATQSLSDDAIELFAVEVGAIIRLVDPGLEREAELSAKYFGDEDDDAEEDLRPRPPIITVMGHVDHGKTLLLDRIREANVVSGEAGGITQHIGAYQAVKEGRLITFIDTPGHEAFTAMRARGAEVTDIVILMVAADDGVMPQTEEAIDHARAAEVPIVVALNKIDRENANPDRVMQQLSEHGLMPEAWGGDTIVVPISALQNTGIDELLEQLLLVADVQLSDELVANPEGRCRGVVLEANLDTGRGPVATVIVENGTLRVGDTLVAGAAWGRVRALIDDKGDNVKEALPSTPVEVLGLNDVPAAGDEFRVADDKAAKALAEHREQRHRFAGLASTAAATGGGAKLEDIFEQIQRGETATLNVILKADVHGSLEAVTASLQKLERDEVKLGFVRRAVGGITESDIQLAATSGATIIGFNVRPDRKARELAENLGVELRLYEIIYKLLEDLEAAMVGMLKPEYEEVITGEAEVRMVFSTPRGKVAGCYVQSGVITRNSKVRYLREGVVIWKGALPSLRRVKDDVREVQAGFECGMMLSDFQDIKEGDVIETYEEREIARV